MTSSEELRYMLGEVAAGKLAPELAAAAIGKWLVYAVGAANGIDMHKITLEAAECEREAAKHIVIATGDVPVFKLKAICARIDAREPLSRRTGEKR